MKFHRYRLKVFGRVGVGFLGVTHAERGTQATLAQMQLHLALIDQELQ